jgi:DUF1680 family protein
MLNFRRAAFVPLLFQVTTMLHAQTEPKVPDKITLKARPFPLTQVRLLDGPFKHAQEKNREYLLSLEPDRLLHTFRLTAGLPSTAKPYGGWEAPACELRGHFVGHYLTGCALTYAATGDVTLKENAAKVVAWMAECQAKFPSGYLSAYPEELIDRVVAKKPVWAPWYTLHKIHAGLLDQYELCGNTQALEVLENTADWIASRMDPLSEQQMQAMLGNEHGGMNEVLTNLYAATGKEKYLKLAQRFNHKAVLDPLARREDKLTGLHANTQFPKVIGISRQYELTGDDSLRTAAEFFWNVVTKERSYVIGGNSDGEHFSPKERLSQHMGPAATETCNTYNMLKLTRHLFFWDPKADYADYYERALINHILASIHPENGMTTYYMPIRNGSARGDGKPHGFGTPTNSFWCCTGTGVESPAKYGDSIYYHADGKALFLNLLIASELDWKEKGLKLRQDTRYPDEPTTKLTFACDKPVELALHIRHPSWAVSGITVAVNGKAEEIKSAPGSYATVSRAWKTGDTVEIAMPMSLHTESFADNPKKIALLHGPLVLCGHTEPRNTFAAIRCDAAKVLDNLKPVAGQPFTFTGPASVFRTSLSKAEGDVTFVPFHKEMKKPYALYWDILDDAQWQAREAAHKAELERQRELEARKVDAVDFFEQNERDHNLRGERTSAGTHMDRRWRHAENGGWFSVELKVQPDIPMELQCGYWGSDGGRVFDILVDGQKIATQKLEKNKPNAFVDVCYPIPQELTKGKEKITVKFQAHPNSTAGGVFGCATVKPKK